MLRVTSSLVFALMLFGIGSVAVQADEINWGDFSGSDVDFFDVTESSDAVGALFGPPLVADNSLVFLPASFMSLSTNGGTNEIEGLLSFSIESTGNSTFNSISIQEFGSFFTDGTTSSAEVFIDASVLTASGLFEESFSLSYGGDLAGDWSGDLKILFPSTESAFFTVNNILITGAGPDGAAFIGKKGITISVGSVSIPEPTVAGFLALAGVSFLRRRRR